MIPERGAPRRSDSSRCPGSADSKPGPRAGDLAALVLVGCALISVAGCAVPTPLPVDRGAGAGTPTDSLATLDPLTAYRRALSLGEQQRFTESLPFFRRALAIPTDAWQPHCDYAISLFHAALESREQRHGLRPAVRSSDERVALMLESARELDRAEELARSEADRAFVVARRARHFAAWGLSWEALLEYTRAARVSPEAAEKAKALLAIMRDPVGAEGTSETAP